MGKRLIDQMYGHGGQPTLVIRDLHRQAAQLHLGVKVYGPRANCDTSFRKLKRLIGVRQAV